MSVTLKTSKGDQPIPFSGDHLKKMFRPHLHRNMKRLWEPKQAEIPNLRKLRTSSHHKNRTVYIGGLGVNIPAFQMHRSWLQDDLFLGISLKHLTMELGRGAGVDKWWTPDWFHLLWFLCFACCLWISPLLFHSICLLRVFVSQDNFPIDTRPFSYEIDAGSWSYPMSLFPLMIVSSPVLCRLGIHAHPGTGQENRIDKLPSVSGCLCRQGTQWADFPRAPCP